MYRQIADCADEAQRKLLQQQAWTLRKKWVMAFKTSRLRDGVIKGKVAVRSKKLHSLESLVDDSGAPVTDYGKWETALTAYFGEKWGTSNIQCRAELMQYLARSEELPFDLPMHVVDAAFSIIRKKRKLDGYGISVASLLLLWKACPVVVRNFLAMFITSTTMVSAMEVPGRVLGKEGPVSSVGKLRVILPLPALMQVVDAILPALIEGYLTSLLPRVPECLVAGRPFTQVLDIAHGVQCVLEKGLDDFGCAAAAQCDIQQFYDSLPLVLIFLRMVGKGVPWGLAAAALRHQACPRIVLLAGAANAPIHDRCIGGLTGSRVAGLLARIPVESTFVERAHVWRKWGFPTQSKDGTWTVLCCASYIDNCFAVSRTPAGAISILEDLENVLNDKWALTMKPTSRSLVEAKGGKRGALDEEKWPKHETFNVLGHWLQDSGSVRACWTRTRKQMWGAFWANVSAAGSMKLPLPLRLKLLLRAVMPILDFKCSRWPPQRQIANELDSVQRKMVAILLRLTPADGETREQFTRRRGRAARQLCLQGGLWSQRWFRRTLDWDTHVRRERNGFTWSAKLVDYRAADYLAQRRAFHHGRTASRSQPGYVSRRWHDGIAFARSQKTVAR